MHKHLMKQGGRTKATIAKQRFIWNMTILHRALDNQENLCVFFSCCGERPANAHNLEIQPYLGEHLCPKPCWANTKTHPPDPHVEQLINPMTWSFTMFYPFDSTYHLGVSKETPVKTSEFNAGAGCIPNVRAYIPNIWGNLRTNYNIGLWQWREHKPGHFGCSTIHFWCDHKHVCRWLSCYERGCMSLQKKKAGYSLNRHFWQKKTNQTTHHQGLSPTSPSFFAGAPALPSSRLVFASQGRAPWLWGQPSLWPFGSQRRWLQSNSPEH